MAETYIPASSSHIAQVEYDAAGQAMTVTHRDGSTYTYANVPPEKFRGLQHAPSAGAYYARQIRGVHATTRSS